MDPELIKQLALGSIPPGIVGVILFAVVSSKPRGATPSLAQRFLPPVVVAAAYCLTHVFVLGKPSVPPVSASDWLPWLVPLISLGSLAFAFRGPAPPKWLAAGICSLAVAALSARNFIAHAWSPTHTALELGAFLIVSLLVLASAQRLTREPGPLAPLLLLLLFTAAGAAVLEITLGSLRLAQACGVFAAFAAGAVLIAFFRRSLVLTAATTTTLALSTLLVLFQGQLTSSDAFAPLYVTLPALSLPAATLATIAPLSRFQGWKAPLLRLALAVLPPAIALAFSLINQQPDPYA